MSCQDSLSPCLGGLHSSWTPGNFDKLTFYFIREDDLAAIAIIWRRTDQTSNNQVIESLPDDVGMRIPAVGPMIERFKAEYRCLN